MRRIKNVNEMMQSYFFARFKIPQIHFFFTYFDRERMIEIQFDLWPFPIAFISKINVLLLCERLIA